MPSTLACVLEELGFDGLKMRQQQVRELREGEVLIAMKAASLNFRDLKIVKGTYARMPHLPVVLLSDGAGEVVEVGPECTAFAPGDRVMPIYMSGWHMGPLSERHDGWKSLGGDVDGTARELAIFHQDDVLRIPDSLSFEQAACFPCAGVTAWHGLVAAGHVKPGDWVLIIGSGGVSLFALQIATMSGGRVIAVSSDNTKLQRLRDLGAVAGINYRTTPNWGDAVRDLADGVGVDQVVEVGGAQTLPQSLRATREGGHIALIGDLSGKAGSTEGTERGIVMSRVVVGSRRMTADLLRAFDVHRKVPVIDRVFSFRKLKSALSYLEAGQHFGKVVVTF